MAWAILHFLDPRNLEVHPTMNRFRMSVVAIAALLIALLACCSAEAGDKAKGKKKAKPVAGEVIEVKAEKGKEEGTLVVKTQVKKKKGDATAAKPEEKTFKVSSDTKVVKVVGKKKDGTPPEAFKFSQIEKGARIRIKANGDKVEEIQVLAAKKKEKKKEKKKKDAAALELF